MCGISSLAKPQEEAMTTTKAKFIFVPSKCICSSNRLLANGQIHHHEKCPDYIPTERERLLIAALANVVNRFENNPGISDLDDEQTMHMRCTLGDVRKWRRLL